MNSYELKQEMRRDRLEKRAARLRQESDARHKKAREMAECIPFGQPILIGHHSEKRDRNFRAKIHNTFGKAFELAKEADEVASRAASVGTGGISSDDPEAVTKIKAEIAEAEAKQVKMIAANKCVRKGDVEGLAALLGATLAKTLMEPGRFAGQGYAGFELTNNGANIRRMKLRLEQLTRVAKAAPEEIEIGGIKVLGVPEENRVRIIFPGKPPAEVRMQLKGYGFRWAPSEGAWQRFYSSTALYHAKALAEKLTCSKP